MHWRGKTSRTLLVFPDLSGMAPTAPPDATKIAAVRASYHSVLVQALNQCATLGDRFLICDLWDGSRGRQRGDHQRSATASAPGT